MKYQSKKHEDIFAEEISRDEKFKTVMLRQLTGEKAGQTFPVTEATIKRWWRKVKDDEVVEDVVEESITEPEVFHVEVEDEETGEVRKVDINPDEVDIDTTQYNFNPPEEEKKYVEVPESVKEYGKDFTEPFKLAGGEKYPEVEEVVDMVVSWGAVVKRFGGFITLEDKTKILFRRHRKVESKSLLEVRMNETTSSRVKSFEIKHEELKSAMCKGLDYVVSVGSTHDLEVLIRELYN